MIKKKSVSLEYKKKVLWSDKYMRKNKYILRTKYCYMYSEYIKHHRNEFIFWNTLKMLNQILTMVI